MARGDRAGGLTPAPSGYADSSAVHLLSRSALALLNQRMAERGTPPLPMHRFRPNIVRLAVRCAVTLVGQEAGTSAQRLTKPPGRPAAGPANPPAAPPCG